MTIWKTSPGAGALDRHGRHTLMSHAGIEFIAAGAPFLRARVLGLTVTVIAKKPA
jgi:hypothetical protein